MNSREKLIDLYVRLPNGNGCMLSLPPKSTLHDLTLQLNSTNLNLPKKYHVSYQGQRIKEYSQSLKQLEIRDKAILHIQPEATVKRGSQTIDVAFILEGNKFVVKISRQENIWTLKKAIAHISGLSPKNQTLVFLGKKLDNDKTLKQYNIDSDSLLNLIVRSADLAVGSHVEVCGGTEDLLGSVQTMAQKKSVGTQNMALFHSANINKRNNQELIPIQVPILNKKINDNEVFTPIHQFDLFGSCKKDKDLKGSFTFQDLFERVGPRIKGVKQLEKNDKERQSATESCEKQEAEEMKTSFLVKQEVITIN